MNNNHKLTFRSNKSLVKLARETITNSNFKIAYRDKYTPKKCFYLVKDDGIYLMNAYSTPSDKTPKTNKTVIYASGYNPKYNDNVWEDSYQVSRDDFADNMYFTYDQLERIANGGDINITITPTSYEVRA
tara:strand:- start:1104 stop:1493 length:390 start_codon:yes stop_codon:yes gene_type:complete